jgi:hypothetical protein
VRAEAQLVEARVVLDDQRDVVAGAQAARAQQAREAVRAVLELAVGDDLAAAGHHDRRLVRRACRVVEGMHRRVSPSVRTARGRQAPRIAARRVRA